MPHHSVTLTAEEIEAVRLALAAGIYAAQESLSDHNPAEQEAARAELRTLLHVSDSSRDDSRTRDRRTARAHRCAEDRRHGKASDSPRIRL